MSVASRTAWRAPVSCSPGVPQIVVVLNNTFALRNIRVHGDPVIATATNLRVKEHWYPEIETKLCRDTRRRHQIIYRERATATRYTRTGLPLSWGLVDTHRLPLEFSPSNCSRVHAVPRPVPPPDRRGSSHPPPSLRHLTARLQNSPKIRSLVANATVTRTGANPPAYRSFRPRSMSIHLYLRIPALRARSEPHRYGVARRTQRAPPTDAHMINRCRRIRRVADYAHVRYRRALRVGRSVPVRRNVTDYFRSP